MFLHVSLKKARALPSSESDEGDGTVAFTVWTRVWQQLVCQHLNFNIIQFSSSGKLVDALKCKLVISSLSDKIEILTLAPSKYIIKKDYGRVQIFWKQAKGEKKTF